MFVDLNTDVLQNYIKVMMYHLSRTFYKHLSILRYYGCIQTNVSTKLIYSNDMMQFIIRGMDIACAFGFRRWPIKMCANFCNMILYRLHMYGLGLLQLLFLLQIVFLLLFRMVV